ncbi:hypothetical protein DFJ74DRAFT_647109 [Hyaloraphidium curvatum]|nr:hypothetical protein DFJ74DRAFT_647109 [Hyaloraphidium curvatum]
MHLHPRVGPLRRLALPGPLGLARELPCRGGARGGPEAAEAALPCSASHGKHSAIAMGAAWFRGAKKHPVITGARVPNMSPHDPPDPRTCAAMPPSISDRAEEPAQERGPAPPPADDRAAAAAGCGGGGAGPTQPARGRRMLIQPPARTGGGHGHLFGEAATGNGGATPDPAPGRARDDRDARSFLTPKPPSLKLHLRKTATGYEHVRREAGGARPARLRTPRLQEPPIDAGSTPSPAPRRRWTEQEDDDFVDEDDSPPARKRRRTVRAPAPEPDPAPAPTPAPRARGRRVKKQKEPQLLRYLRKAGESAAAERPVAGVAEEGEHSHSDATAGADGGATGGTEPPVDDDLRRTAELLQEFVRRRVVFDAIRFGLPNGRGPAVAELLEAGELAPLPAATPEHVAHLEKLEDGWTRKAAERGTPGKWSLGNERGDVSKLATADWGKLCLLADFPVNAEEQFGVGSRGVKYPREPNGLPYDVCLTGFQYQKIAPAIGFGAMCLDGKPIVADAKDKNGPFDITNAHDLELLDLVLGFGLAAGATKMLALSAIMREGVVFALRKGFGGRYEGETEVSAGGVRLPLHVFTDLSVEGRRDIALAVAGTPHLQLLINPGVSLVVSLGLCTVVSVTGRGMSLEGIMRVLSAGCGPSHEQLVEFLRLLKERATPKALDALRKELETDPGMDARQQIHFLFSHAGGVMLGELKDVVRSIVAKPVRRRLFDKSYALIAEKPTPGARGKEALKQLEGLGEDGAALATKRLRDSGAGPALFACLSEFEGGEWIKELAR